FDIGDYDCKDYYAYLALYYKGKVPENIRCYWLIKMAKQSKKAQNNNSNIKTVGLLYIC
ncbi:33109_t:CDS:2, partial [Gigaspora margarita]